MYGKEENRTVHLLILISYSILTAALIGESILLKWDTGVVVLLVFGLIASWFSHIVEKLPEMARLWMYFIFSMLSVFFYGIHETSMFDLAPLMIIVIIIFYAAQIPQMIGISVFTYYLTMIYDFVFVIHGSMEINSLTITRTILHFALVSIAGFLTNYITKNRKKGEIITKNIIAELEETNRRTEDFLTNVSHELRTPINVVTGITSVMLNKEKDAERRKDLLSIQTAGRRLFEQIGAILDYTEIDTGRITVSEDSYMISSLINDVIIKSCLPEKETNLELIFDVDAEIPSVLFGDEKKIKKILGHLIDNAMKFTKKGGIYVRVYALQKPYGINLCMTVSDTGIGIAEEELEKITERFYQSNGGRNRRSGGLGLGLSIVYGMVSVMKGFLQICSTEGKGTTISVSIPQKVMNEGKAITLHNRKELCLACYLRPEKYETPEIRDYYNEMISHMIQGFDSLLHRVFNMDELKRLTSMYELTHLFIGKEEYEEDKAYFERMAQNMKVILVADAHFTLPKGSKMQILRKPFYSLPIINILNAEVGETENLYKEKRMVCPGIRVLVVDDEPMNLMVAEGIFRDYEMDVTLADRGRKAIELCEMEEFDLIFLDHMMPEMDGVETLKRIRKIQTDEGKTFTVIAFTANAVSGAREMLMREGFDEFVSKPVEPLELEHVLKKMLPKYAIKFVYKDSSNTDDMETHAEGKEQGAGGQLTEKESEEDIFLRLKESGIDSAAGMQYCRGEKEFYIEGLLKFAKDAGQKAKEIDDFFKKEDFDNYKTMVHALKSTAKMIGADALSENAKSLEMAAKNQEADYIREHHEEVLAEYRQVVQCILGLYDSDAESRSQESQEVTGELSKEEFLRRLEDLKEKLDTFEEESSQTLISEMSGATCQGESIGVLLSDVWQDVDDFEFPAASEKVEALIAKMEGGEAQ